MNDSIFQFSGATIFDDHMDVSLQIRPPSGVSGKTSIILKQGYTAIKEKETDDYNIYLTYSDLIPGTVYTITCVFNANDNSFTESYDYKFTTTTPTIESVGLITYELTSTYASFLVESEIIGSQQNKEYEGWESSVSVTNFIPSHEDYEVQESSFIECKNLTPETVYNLYIKFELIHTKTHKTISKSANTRFFTPIAQTKIWVKNPNTGEWEQGELWAKKGNRWYEAIKYKINLQEVNLV